MAMNMTRERRFYIIKHVLDIYFPSGIEESIWNTLPGIWEDYLLETVGPVPKGVNIPKVSIKIVTKDPKLKRFLESNYTFRYFWGTAATFPFCTAQGDLDSTYILDFDNCPIGRLRDTLTALADLYNEKADFETALNSELLKAPSVETFLKRFPEMKASMTPWVKDVVADLPVECEINMEEITVMENTGSEAV